MAQDGEGVSTLEYDFTIPMKFMVGGEGGGVYRYCRKAGAHSDLETVYLAQLGSVYSVHRFHGSHFRLG